MNKILLLILTLQTVTSFGQTMNRRDVDIGKGISLHVVEQGEGEPLIFIHGVWHSLLQAGSDDQALPPNHSAIVEAEDLVRFSSHLLTAIPVR